MPATYVLLERIELNASAASVTFANIPQSGYTDLKIVISGRTAGTGTWGLVYVSPNGATTSLTSKILFGYGSGQGSASYSSNSAIWGYLSGTDSTVSTFSNTEFYIPNYNSTSTSKSFSVDSVSENNATDARQSMTAGLWSSNSAITSLTFTPKDSADLTTSFAAGSTFSLYGLAALGTTPVIAPKAFGGNRIDYDGTYWIHTFTSSGTFTPTSGLSCDYLVVAGGGAGGIAANGGGGGGAGGLRSSVSPTGGGGSAESSLSLASGTSYTVTIGAGGASRSTRGQGNVGSNSVFSTVTSAGGGGGGGNGGVPGGNGGSGGGGALNQTGGTGTSNQGFAGGDGATYTGANDCGGGGGGAGQAGIKPLSNVGGAGGNGVSNSITGSAVNYGGGGGGSSDNASTRSSGGSGGGGEGGGNSGGTQNGGNGSPNTGGGGGSANGGASYTSGSGGSGIVIIRYLAA
jgi:hypothetical protein